MFTCQKCERVFLTQDALNAHMGVHNNSYVTRHLKVQKSLIPYFNELKKQKQIKIDQYLQNPKLCKLCTKIIPYEKALKQFYCSSSCAASVNNRGRKRSQSQKDKLSQLFKGRTAYNKGIKSGPRLDKRIPLIEWCCPICKKIISLKPYVAKNRKFCSGTCRNIINNQKIYGQRSKAEKYLEEQLKIKFPTWEILFNDRKILNGLELDVYIPHLKLAIEWNGIYHLKKIHNDQKFLRVQEKDAEKHLSCQEKNINLIVVADLTSHSRFIKEKTMELIDIIDKIDKDIPCII